MHRFLACSAAVVLAAGFCAPIFGAVVFSENFDVDHTADWTVNKGPVPLAQDANFFFDYSTVGIPPAPNSSGTTRGLRLRANLPGNTGTFSGLSVSPTGFSVEGSYELRCDAWLNYPGPLAAGGTGSTQCTGWGILTNGTAAQWAGGVQNGLWFAMTGDGGSSVDYRAYSPAAGTGYLPASGVFAAGTGTSPDSRNNTHPYYAAIGGIAAPAAQLALYPGQTEATGVGAPGFKWWRVIVNKSGDIVTWTLQDPTGTLSPLLIATVDATTFTSSGNNILFNHFDINAGQTNAGSDAELLFGLIDNIEVEQFLGPPTITDQPDDLLIGIGDDAVFTVAALPGASGALHYAWSKTLNNVTTPVGGDSPVLSLTDVPYSDNGATFSVVVSEEGNPLTRTSRAAILTVALPPCNDPFADADGDGIVDMNDFGEWQTCYTGPGGEGFDATACRCFDRNHDETIDAVDLAAFMACAGSNPIAADPACDDTFFPTGTVVINEIVYDQVTAVGGAVADTSEFVELYNAGATPVDISGWLLRASDEVGPEPSVGNPTGDNNPDYRIPGLPGSGTTILASGGFYVIGSASVLNVNQVVTSASAQGLWEDFREALELIDGNGIVKDTLVYNKSQGSDGAIAIGTPEGRVWGDFSTIALNNQSLSRYVDGRDTNDNGRDFGMRMPTPGESNHASSPDITAYVPPNVDAETVGAPVAGLNGAFKEARVIDPTVQSPLTGTNLDQAGLNPNAIPASPQGGNCIIAWDESGGGNAVWSNGLMTTNGSFDLWVYLDTSDITVPGAESTSYGIMGTTAPFYLFPDPTGNFFSTTSILSNGNTGLAWVFQKNNAGNHKRLVLVDAKDGGDSSLFGGMHWTTVQEIDMSAVASGWYRLSIQYTGATGAVLARFRDSSSADLVTPINYASAANLVGGFYVGYRESLAGQPVTLRPPTFDLVP